jgi:hypothetical protein
MRQPSNFSYLYILSRVTPPRHGVIDTSTQGGIMESRSERTTNTLMLIVGIPLGIALMIWTAWITVTAFIGGQAPFFFLEFDGFNLIRGLFWLIIVDPIVLTVAYWIFMLLMLPLIGLAAGASAIANRKHEK